MPLKHVFVSAKSDSADATLVQPSHWNADHISTDPENETPTGTIDSTDGSDGNGTFTLSAAPSPASSLHLYKNGLLQLSGTHFNLSSSTITYVDGSKPRVGDWHRATFRKA